MYLAVVNAPVELSPDETAYFGADVERRRRRGRRGRRRHRRRRSGPPRCPASRSGAATVVNDLVLTTLLDGTLVALDRASGEIVHTLDLGGGTNGWMAVVDDMLIVPLGTSPPARIVALGL